MYAKLAFAIGLFKIKRALLTLAQQIKALFTFGEQGAWYEKSDFERYMAGRGAELVTNRTFDTDTSGWSAANGTIALVSQTLEMTSSGYGAAQTTISVTVGKSYEIVFDYIQGSNNAASLRVVLGYGSGSPAQFDTASTAGQKRCILTAGVGGSITLALSLLDATATRNGRFDNVSVKELTALNTATLFQDSVGTTPVTAVEQLVGLKLDKRLGLVRGTELVVNGGFADGLTSWGGTDQTGYSVIAGQLNVALAIKNNAESFIQYFPTVVGKTYEVSVDYVVTTNQFIVDLGAYRKRNLTGSGTLRGTFVAISASSYVSAFAENAAGSFAGVFDNFSIKLLDGNHATQATAAARPTLSARVNLLVASEDFNAAIWGKTSVTVTSGASDPLGGTSAVTVTSNAANGNIVQNPTVQGTLATSVWIRRSVGVGAVQTITADGNTWVTQTITSSWALYQNTATSTFQGGNGVRFAVSGDAVEIWHPQLERGSAATTYQRVDTAADYDTVGFPYYEKLDGIDDSMGSATGGGGTAGIFFGTAIKPTGGAGTNRTIWSDAGANTGYRVRINAANQLELASGNGTPLTPPVQAAAATSTTGGTGLAASTAYFYVVTAFNGKGESLKSNEISVTTGLGTTNSNTVNWAASAGAASYRVYRGTATGVNNVYYTLGNVLTYVDTGAASTAGSPPTVSETAYTKATSVATVDVGTTNVVTAWDETRARVNLCTESEFRNGVSDAPSRGGLVTATTLTGYLGALAFGHDGVTQGTAIKNLVAATVGVTYTLSVIVKMDDGLVPVFGNVAAGSSLNDFSLVIANDVLDPPAQVIVNLGGGLYRVSLSKAATSVGSGFGVVKYATNSNRTFKVTAYQVEVSPSVTTYQRVNTAGDFDNRLLNVQVHSRARVNLLTKTEDFGDAVWPKYDLTITPNTAADSTGVMTLDKFTENSATGVHGIRRNPLSVAGVSVASFEAKAAERSIIAAYNNNNDEGAEFNLAAGTVTNIGTAVGTITPLGGGIYQCTVKITNNGDVLWLAVRATSGVPSYLGVVGNGLHVGRVQLEAGTVATRYQRVNTVTDFDRNLYGQEGAITQIGTIAPSAGTAGYTLGKDNGAATSFFMGNIYSEVYRKDSGLTAVERTSVKNYVANQAKVTL